MEKYFIGDACLCWSLGGDIEKSVSARVLSIYRTLKSMPSVYKMGVLDLVPSYNALAVHFDPATARLEEITETIDAIFESRALPDHNTPGNTVVLPVVYDGEDLVRVAELNGLTVKEVIRIHQEAAYTVAMVGFLPHFPYMIGLDPRLETPRLDSPRTRVPAGAVGIGGAQAGVYPSESPGGWNLIGSMDPKLLIPVKPGDTILFKEL